MAAGRHPHQQPGACLCVCPGGLLGGVECADKVWWLLRVVQLVADGKLVRHRPIAVFAGCVWLSALRVSCPPVQYNTCYWCLVKSGKTPAEAQATLKVGERPR